MERSGCRISLAAIVLLAMWRCSHPDLPVGDIKGGDGALRLSLPGEPCVLARGGRVTDPAAPDYTFNLIRMPRR